MPDAEIVDTTWYDQDDTNIADMTSQNSRYCKFQYQKPTAGTNNDNGTEISNHA